MPRSKRLHQLVLSPLKNNLIRKTVSLTETVWQWAQVCMREKGFLTFSSYVAQLIRQDRKRRDRLKH